MFFSTSGLVAWLLRRAAILLSIAVNVVHAAALDEIHFGDARSEQKHALVAENSQSTTGGLLQNCRILLPPSQIGYKGGGVRFQMRVDGSRQNFLTVKLWGEDIAEGRLVLFVDGKQIGYQHLGDVEVLDTGTQEKGYAGRFYYRTQPLPRSSTDGASTVMCEVRAYGKIWSYGKNIEQYQRNMEQPSRGLYSIYTHTEPYFTPNGQELVGQAPKASIRGFSDIEVLAGIKKRMVSTVLSILKDKKPPGQMPMQFLAKARSTSWLDLQNQPLVMAKLAEGLDHLACRVQREPALLTSGDPSTPNPDWFGLGPAGDVLRLLGPELSAVADVVLPLPDGSKPTRRAAWSAMLVASRDYLRSHRRSYSNQSMIVDLNMYRCDAGIASLDPKQALPAGEALGYLHESAGLKPWSGNAHSYPLGKDYLLLTKQGLTKELGYVGIYGEVLDWVEQLHEVTKLPGVGNSGDPQLNEQLKKIAKARAVFRYPSQDNDGFQTFRVETAVGWRDDHFPGDVCYGQRNSWDASALSVASATQDETLIGYAQQQLEDQQYFPTLQERLGESGWRVNLGLLRILDDYAWIKKQAPTKRKLPMSSGEPDFVWADPEIGVLAIKHGEERLYASLYWRSRYAVNNLARLHVLKPSFSSIVTLPELAIFERGKKEWKRPNWTNFGFASGGPKYPEKLFSAHEGEKLSIARVPADVAYEVGQENAYAGKAQLYMVRYGPYVLAMNTSSQAKHTIPAIGGGRPKVRNLSNGKTVSTQSPLELEPGETLVAKLD
jgi:hypothetical protein